jgi:hypothetical protein
MFDRDSEKRGPKFSPLYTSKAQAKTKKELVKEMGRDSDGAYRYERRIDRKN